MYVDTHRVGSSTAHISALTENTENRHGVVYLASSEFSSFYKAYCVFIFWWIIDGCKAERRMKKRGRIRT
ncbi:hypothetical protein CHS0354_023364, partial [Potamilus streckersoni]